MKILFAVALVFHFFTINANNPGTTSSQNPDSTKRKSDLELLQKSNFETNKYDSRVVTPLFAGRPALVRYNPVSLAFTGLMLIYQKVVSQQISSGCSYEVSCSAFSKKCVAEFGLLKGVAMSADRLMRCNRIAAYDIHPMHITEEDKIRDPLEKYRHSPYHQPPVYHP